MQKSANGALILVMGILSWILCGFFTGIPAWIMGNNSLAAIDRGEADSNERGLVQAGRILGMVSTILYALGIVGAIIAMAMGVALFGAAAASSGPPR